MKAIFSIICLSLNLFAFGQNTTDYSPAVPPPSTNIPDLKADVTKIYDKPDKMPEFPGGIAAFETKIREYADIANFKKSDGDNVFKSIISLTVERDGSITGVKATGVNEEFNKEVYRAARSIRTKWKSGQYKGENVRSKMQIPLTMSFE